MKNNHTILNNSKLKFQKGLSLIEVLISLVILSVGLLSLAHMQITAIKNTNSAVQRTDAVNLAYDIADRMRSNRSLALSGSYNISLNAAAPTGTSIAAVDLQEWVNNVKNLPSGTGSVSVSGNMASIVIQWADNSNLIGSSGSSTLQVVVRAGI